MTCAIVDRVLGTGTLELHESLSRVASEFWLASVRLGLTTCFKAFTCLH